MKRYDFLKKITVEDFIKHSMEEDEYDITELACKRKMQIVRNDELPCHGKDADNCFPAICRGCVIDYLNEEVDENGQAIDDDGRRMEENNGCSQGDNQCS